MNILIVSGHNISISRSGAENRIFMLAKALAQKANVCLLHQGSNIISGKLEIIGYRPIIKKEWNGAPIIRGVNNYLTPFSQDLLMKLRKLMITQDFDIVQVEMPYPFTQVYSCIKSMHLKKSPILILDEHDVELLNVLFKGSMKDLKNHLVSFFQAIYVFPWEAFAVRASDIVCCVSYEDKYRLTTLYKIHPKKVIIVPNGVDVRRFKFHKKTNIGSGKKTIFFHGTLSWYPNLEATNIIVEYIAPKIPEALFLIAGADAPMSLLKKIRRLQNVKYLGYVGDLEKWITSSDVCIAPLLHGGGTKLKILEYAAAGKPIVGTYKAIEGLGMINSIHGLFYKDVSEDFIQGIRMLLLDESFAKKLGENAKIKAFEYDWQKIGEKLHEEYIKILQNL